MKCKTLLLMLIVSALLLTSTACTPPEAEKETIMVLADYPWYDSIDELYEKADLVIEGKILASRVEWTNHVIGPSEEDTDDPCLNPGGDYEPQEQITTIYTVEVRDVYKGSAGEIIDLIQIGGETDTVICTCPDAADIEINGEYVLFLNASRLHENSAWLLSPTQAIYKIDGDKCISDPDNPLDLSHEALTAPNSGRTVPSVGEVSVEIDEERLTFDQALQRSHVIVAAHLDKIIKKDTYRELHFTRTESIKGTMKENLFLVREPIANYNHGFTTEQSQYQKGGDYILVLEKTISVYVGDYYHIVGHIFIPIGGEGAALDCQMYRESLDMGYSDINELTEYIAGVTQLDVVATPHGIPYTTSANLSDMATASQYILHVRIGDIEISADNRNTYRCAVLEVLKGNAKSEIKAVLLKGTVRKGQEYILFLNKENAASLLYVLASPHGAIPVNHDEKVRRIRDQLTE